MAGCKSVLDMPLAMKAAVKILAAQQASSMKAVPGKSPKKPHGRSKPSKQKWNVVKKTIQKRTLGYIFSMVNVKCMVLIVIMNLSLAIV